MFCYWNLIVLLGIAHTATPVLGDEQTIRQAEQPLVYGDRWNYGSTVQRGDGFNDYGPRDWGSIVCNEEDVSGLDACLAYQDKWHTGQGWEIKDNYCRWCPAETPDSCGRHHMSPINLERSRGLGYWEKTTELNDGNPGEGAHPDAKECLDVHWMKYEDSWCSLDQLREADAFTIERHALRITQPITVLNHEADELQIDCYRPGRGRRFGRIDYSKGFSDWWFLSHIDFHVPSEHTQEGKRYDGELQLQHFYSVNRTIGGVSNQMGTVSIFLQAYDNAPPYRYLDKVICLWREHEYNVRSKCGLPPVDNHYPGCFPFRRNLRDIRGGSNIRSSRRYKTVYDWILARNRMDPTNNSITFPDLKMEASNFEEQEMSDTEWEDFIATESSKLRNEEKTWRHFSELHNDTVRAHQEFHDYHRKLIGGEELDWFNYFPMLGVRTEYYYRYEGSQTIPPCYGTYIENSRRQTNHWRVMKDPIRIHKRQLTEMKRLLKERIAPIDSATNACKGDTAAVVEGNNVYAARPLQSNHPVHFKVFCECKDWPSKWPEDREWCKIDDVHERFYRSPYNYASKGF